MKWLNLIPAKFAINTSHKESTMLRNMKKGVAQKIHSKNKEKEENIGNNGNKPKDLD